MRVLLDTHTFIWMADSPEKLSRRARVICEEEGSLVLSVASVWELAIKARLGRLTFAESIETWVLRQTPIGGISILPILVPHAIRAGGLESEHKDPFDRMLAAQCLEEHLPCVTKDRFFSQCGVEIIW
jgi:PIN domain nuclease of toxin-antitoxin system